MNCDRLYYLPQSHAHNMCITCTPSFTCTQHCLPTLHCNRLNYLPQSHAHNMCITCTPHGFHVHTTLSFQNALQQITLPPSIPCTQYVYHMHTTWVSHAYHMGFTCTPNGFHMHTAHGFHKYT